tara:strand:+ start:1476 stop:2060 length:585 start_codon:yes stop_codon:yes gene_type:complete
MDKKKLFDLILFIGNKVNKFKSGSLKVNKLIWFIESEAYRTRGRTITGVDFVALPKGPVMDNYKALFSEMESLGLIECSYSDAGRKLFSTKKDTALDRLEDGEKLIVEHFISGFKDLGEATLEGMSHKDAWNITLHESNNKFGEIIDMDLVLLESNPFKNLPIVTDEDSRELKKIAENLPSSCMSSITTLKEAS